MESQLLWESEHSQFIKRVAKEAKMVGGKGVGVSQRTDAFVDAAAAGDDDVVRRRLKSGQQVNAVHSFLRYTALYGAAGFGHTQGA